MMPFSVELVNQRAISTRTFLVSHVKIKKMSKHSFTGRIFIKLSRFVHSELVC